VEWFSVLTLSVCDSRERNLGYFEVLVASTLKWSFPFDFMQSPWHERSWGRASCFPASRRKRCVWL
jgi:hypothetical protein